MDYSRIEERRLYHVLYADEIRLGSLDAQLNKSVPIKLTEKDEHEIRETLSGEGGIGGILKGGKTEVNSATISKSTEYAFLDARYFDILERLNVNLEQPEDFSPEIIDGNIHLFRGVLKISGVSAFTPILKSLQALLPVMRKNPKIFNNQNGENFKGNEIKAMEEIAKILPQMPMPSTFRLHIQNKWSIVGPIDDNAVRLNMENMMLLFNGQMPFEWLVAGYLYPVQKPLDAQSNDFIEIMESTIQTMAPFFTPQADAILLPLLILR